MRKFLPFLIFASLIVGPLPAVRPGQRGESYLEPFQRTLRDSFIGILAVQGKKVTSRHRAMFMGYILHRQRSRVGEFEMDKLRMSWLVSEVKEFLQAVSPEEDFWPVVEAGMRGEFDQEVEAMLGGSAYVEAVFPTLKELAWDWQKQDYSPDRYAGYPGHEKILQITLTFLQLLKEKRYPEALRLSGGRLHEQLNKLFSESAPYSGQRDRFLQYIDSLEWKAGEAGLADSDPPMARIVFSLRDQKGKWSDDPCVLILDRGVWKIVRFLD